MSRRWSVLMLVCAAVLEVLVLAFACGQPGDPPGEPSWDPVNTRDRVVDGGKDAS